MLEAEAKGFMQTSGRCCAKGNVDSEQAKFTTAPDVRLQILNAGLLRMRLQASRRLEKMKARAFKKWEVWDKLCQASRRLERNAATSKLFND